MAWCKVFFQLAKDHFLPSLNKGFKTNHQAYWRAFGFAGSKLAYKNGFTSIIFIHNTEREEQKDAADPI